CIVWYCPGLCSLYTVTTHHYTLSLHDALPICFLAAFGVIRQPVQNQVQVPCVFAGGHGGAVQPGKGPGEFTKTVCQRVTFHDLRSEEHTSELQSRENLVCRLLLEKKKKGVQ